MKYAVLIDGGFIKRKLGSQTRPLMIAGVAAFLERLKALDALNGMTLHRIYWYDAPPLDITVMRPLRGGRINFSATALARANHILLKELGKLPHVSVRRGDLVFRGWRVRQVRLLEREPTITVSAQDLEPNIHQKGVDLRIGLDIAALTMKAHANVIILVTADSDFVPAMKFARREGAQLYLVTFGHSMRADMLEHSDLVLEMPVSSAEIDRCEGAHAA